MGNTGNESYWSWVSGFYRSFQKYNQAILNITYLTLTIKPTMLSKIFIFIANSIGLTFDSSSFSANIKNLISYLILFKKHKFSSEKNELVIVKIQKFKVKAYGFANLFHLYKEIFLKNSYSFHSDKKDPLIIDCGANIGLSALYFKSLYPESRIIAFEPSPSAFELLNKNISFNKLKGIRTFDIALSDKKESSPFYYNDIPGSLNGSTKKFYQGSNQIMIQKDLLSSYIDQEIDFLKIDVEGSEWEIIGDLIESGMINKIRHIKVEYHHLVHSKNKCSDFISKLENNDFKVLLHTQSDSDTYQDIMIEAFRSTGEDAVVFGTK